MDNEEDNIMSKEEMLELDDSVENDKELQEKVGEVKNLDDLDESQLEE